MSTRWHTEDLDLLSPAEASTEVGADQGDDIAGARGIINAIAITVCCALIGLALAAVWSIA